VGTADGLGETERRTVAEWEDDDERGYIAVPGPVIACCGVVSRARPAGSGGKLLLMVVGRASAAAAVAAAAAATCYVRGQLHC